MGTGFWGTGFLTAGSRRLGELRAIVFICGIMLLACPAQSIAGSISAPAVVAPLARALSGEPFGRKVAMLMDGGLRDKWLGLEQRLEQERRTLEGCRDDRAHCTSSEALRFLAIVDSAASREGLARLGEINRAINLAIRPEDDLVNYGMTDYWSAPLATLARGSGDCEDYAIAKLVALKAAGIAASDLRLVIVRDAARAEDHALVAVRFDEQWMMLDNRRMVMLRDTDMAFYRPTFVISENGVAAFQQEAPSPARALEPDLIAATAELVPPSFGDVPY